MSAIRPQSDVLNAAAHAVVEYALVSLEPEFHRWEQSVNLRAAQCVWNARSMGWDPPDPPSRDPALAELIARLARVRSTRWKDEVFLVLALDVRHEDGEVFFTFDLTWDEGDTFHPCEIALDHSIVSAAAN